MDFGEKKTEKYFGKEIPVWQTPKYEATKEKVIKLIEKGTFKDVLSASDFWILKNTNKDKTRMDYSGLIINHDALVRINDKLDENTRFDQKYCSDVKEYVWNNTTTLRLEYRDERDGMFEVGEISANNCKNDYPFAMLFKRVFDRVVKRKAKLSYVYSDSEADEFREKSEEKNDEPMATQTQKDLINQYHSLIEPLLWKKVNDLTLSEASEICKEIERLKKKI